MPLTHWPIHDLMDHNLDKLRRADLKNAIGTGGVARTAISALQGTRILRGWS